MNFLLHAFLSCETPAAMAGGLLGDFVKGRSFDHLPAGVAAAIRLHRSIDSFSDRNEIYQRSRLRLHPKYRRVSGIIIDMIYDHYLAKRWDEFSETPIEQFTVMVYSALIEFRHCWTDRFSNIAPYLIEHDWLGSYQFLEGTERALKGMSRRMKYENPLNTAIVEIDRHYIQLEQDFLELMPELVAFAEREKAVLKNSGDLT